MVDREKIINATKSNFNFPFWLFIAVLVASCNKVPKSKSFNPFYNLTVDGQKKSIGACGTTDYVAQYLDTSVFAAFGCGGQRAGFHLKGNITDGTYQLNDKNMAWFDEGAMTYTTDGSHEGSLSIRTGSHKIDGSSIPFIEGEISFDAIDSNSGKTIRVTNGKYLLKKY
jgi:hypothetical protein